jgi:hypothetical protein
MLHYESSLVRLFRTIFYSLPLTIGITEEKQKVELNFFDDYIDDSVSRMKLSEIGLVTIHSLKLELHEQQNCCNLQQNLISTHVN